MRGLISIFFFVSIPFLMVGQGIILISNPSFEVRKGTEQMLPMGWTCPEVKNYSEAKVQWKNDNIEPSHGQSYITLNNSDSTNQVIAQLLSNNPIQAYTTYRMEIDAAILDNSTESKLQVIGIGKSIDERHVLATSWPIDQRKWKKIILKLSPTIDIYAIQIESISDDRNTILALDNISHLTRIIGQYDCKEFYQNGYSRHEIISENIQTKDQQYEVSEGKYHCVYTSFYTQKILFDKYGPWDDVVFYNDNQSEKLLWNNVKLLPDSNEKFRIAATGYEDEFGIYASIFVFDSEGNNMLSSKNPLAEKIMNIIGGLIQGNDENDKRFYELYEEEIGH